MALLPTERRDKIISILGESDYADISSLSLLFDVSEMTIRRDIEKLENEGEVIRSYGGVKLKTKRNFEGTVIERLNTNKEEKMAITKEAAKWIEDGDVIAFDASSTALELSKLIKDRQKLTVVTNSIGIAIELSEAEGITVIMLGGFLRGKSLSMVGNSLNKYLESIYVDKAFISSKALNFNEGLTDTTIDEGEAKQSMIKRANAVYVMVDHTKVGKLAFFKVCGKEKIDKIFTDRLKQLSPEQEECLKQFKEYGTDVLVVE